MFCRNCGTQIADHVKFCPACGKPTGTQPVSNQSRPTDQTAQPNQPNQPKQPTMPKGHFKKKLNIGNFIVWAGCLAAFISLFLNFATASIDIGIASASESVRLIDADDGIFFIIVIVAVAVINLFKLNIVTIPGSCVGLFFLYLELANIKDQLGAFESLVTYGAGRTLLILGIILMLAGSVTALILNLRAKKAAGF